MKKLYRKMNMYFFEEETIPVREACFFYGPFIIGIICSLIALQARIFS